MTDHRPFLVMNPRSGGGKVERLHLREEAERLGARVELVAGNEPLTATLHRAVDEGASLLGVAGGDGSLAAVAGVAAERDVPLLVIPAGTRNHFALDLGLDRTDPRTALDALVAGEEIVVDLGMAGEDAFVNNVSLGAYAELVARPDYRADKLRVIVEHLPHALSHAEQHFTVRAGAVDVTNPGVALISNNPYRPVDVRRPRLDGGVLGLLVVQAPEREPMHPGSRPPEPRRPVQSTSAEQVTVETDADELLVAVDGESVTLPVPLVCTIRHRALRVRVPRQSDRPRSW